VTIGDNVGAWRQVWCQQTTSPSADGVIAGGGTKILSNRASRTVPLLGLSATEMANRFEG